jgi:hypothetical protein
MKLLLLFMLLNTAKPYADTVQNKTPYFIAMEYKGMSNCIYKVFITDSLIMCAKVNGYITVEPSFGMGTVVPREVMHIPEAYVNRNMEGKYAGLLSDNQQFMKADKANFIIRKSGIARIYHNPEKKWGMGYYPHHGRIIIQTKTKVKGYNNSLERELILIGDQDPDVILKMLRG